MTLMTSVCVHFYVLNGLPHVVDDEKSGLVRDLNPGPLAPKARIIPLDQTANDNRCAALVETHTTRKDTLSNDATETNHARIQWCNAVPP